MANGTKDDRGGRSAGGDSLWHKAWRFFAFVLLACSSLLILAALYLLPAYQKMVKAQYDRDCASLRMTALEQYVQRTEELIRVLPEDENLTGRLRIAQEGAKVPNETIVVDPAAPPAALPGTVSPPIVKLPPPPSNILLELADRLDDARTRRGLMLLWILSLAVALLLFWPKRSRRNAKIEEDPLAP